MRVAVCRLTLRLHDNRSLKGKRQIVRSLIDRIRHRFEVSIAEVGDQDRLKSARIGIAAVSGDARHATEMMDRVVEYAEAQLFEADVIDIERDLIDLD
ncbi:MAG: DUF503 domain-containing protein [Chloroflexi bacterium]|nr:DUF503 domain-containing protein [Chloroflexota bacterium]MCH8235905.1 DUF503 domain-containing protein [Chloroflexota bacterium]MCH8816536.1 DUF503 domain-containing protein [Chloroflexota bacterium]